MAYLDTLDRPACYTDDHHGRIIRRWRRKAKGVTATAAASMLVDFGTSAGWFVRWAYENDLAPILRGTL